MVLADINMSACVVLCRIGGLSVDEVAGLVVQSGVTCGLYGGGYAVGDGEAVGREGRTYAATVDGGLTVGGS